MASNKTDPVCSLCKKVFPNVAIKKLHTKYDCARHLKDHDLCPISPSNSTQNPSTSSYKQNMLDSETDPEIHEEAETDSEDHSQVEDVIRLLDCGFKRIVKKGEDGGVIGVEYIIYLNNKNHICTSNNLDSIIQNLLSHEDPPLNQLKKSHFIFTKKVLLEDDNREIVMPQVLKKKFNDKEEQKKRKAFLEAEENMLLSQDEIRFVREPNSNPPKKQKSEIAAPNKTLKKTAASKKLAKKVSEKPDNKSKLSSKSTKDGKNAKKKKSVPKEDQGEDEAEEAVVAKEAELAKNSDAEQVVAAKKAGLAENSNAEVLVAAAKAKENEAATAKDTAAAEEAVASEKEKENEVAKANDTAPAPLSENSNADDTEDEAEKESEEPVAEAEKENSNADDTEEPVAEAEKENSNADDTDDEAEKESQEPVAAKKAKENAAAKKAKENAAAKKTKEAVLGKKAKDTKKANNLDKGDEDNALNDESADLASNHELPGVRRKSKATKTKTVIGYVAKKPKKYTHKAKKTSVSALKEIRRLQKTTEFLMKKLPFSRLVRQIAFDMRPTGNMFQSSALGCLQTAAEAFLISLFDDIQVCACHAQRVTIKIQDLWLAIRLRGDTPTSDFNNRSQVNPVYKGPFKQV